jgi:hypothetical protein
VCCLAGANGIGKSTFVSAVNFAITGRIAEPGRRFESVEEYYRDTLTFTRAYFNGRILEAERDTAAVSVKFSIGDTEFNVTRRVAQPDELRELSVVHLHSKESVVDGHSLTPEVRHEEYIRTVIEAARLDSFPQFVFLQLFLMTFDERRNLLF